MKKQKITGQFAICVAGFAAGWLVHSLFSRKQPTLQPEIILRRVKQQLTKKIPLNGAWIYTSPRKWARGPLEQSVYQGGLIVKSDLKLIHYDFKAEAHTGTLLELRVQA